MKRAFTTIETLVFVSIFVLVLGGIVVALNYTYRANRFIFEQADAATQARRGVETLVQNLREAAYADDGAFPIVSIAENSITIYSDANDDTSAERITFSIANEALSRGVVYATGTPPTYSGATTTTAVAQFIRNEALSVPLFTYYDAAGTEITGYSNVADVASVLVRLVVNLYPERAPEDFEIRSRATFRNNL